MNKKIILLLLVIFAPKLYADNVSGLTVTHLRMHTNWGSSTSYAAVGVDSVPAGLNTSGSNGQICFQFKATSAEGKLMFSLLLAAKSSGQKIRVWFAPNTNGGTNLSSLSELQVVELQ